MNIDADRLLRDLRQLAGFGTYQTGVDRIAFSAQDIAARRWLAEQLTDAGLVAELDRYGTVIGRAPGVDRAPLVGSHSDTVPRGGWLDGAMGVIYGLEIARSLRRDGRPAIDVVSFQDEEGTFIPCLGSKAFCSRLGDAEIASAVGGPDRTPLTQAMGAHDLPAGITTLDRARHTAYFEAHIEQGPRLEQSGIRIGVVTGIVGIRRFRVVARGQADHAGTTPLGMRRDAGARLIAFAHDLLARVGAAAGENTVWNVGAMSFSPGAPNVVPAEATLTFEFRDIDLARLEDLVALFHTTVGAHDGQLGVRLSAQSLGQVEPVLLDKSLGGLIAAASRAHGVDPAYLPSGAGHDAMLLGQEIPSAMLFVPSIGGRSHSVEENTADDDIVLGARVLGDAIEAYLQG